LAYQNDTVPPCGLFGWSLFCPFQCGFFKRLFRIGNCTNKKIEPVPVPTSTSVLVPIPAPVPVPIPVPVPLPVPVSACVEATTIDLTGSITILGTTNNITDVDTVRITTNHSSCAYFNGIGVWYKIKPFTNNANLRATTCNGGTNFDTVITVYGGDNCRPQVCVAQNNDYGDSCSNVDFAVSSSTTYWIFVDCAGTANPTQGNFELTVGFITTETVGVIPP
jgi:hypothetical protein